MDFGAKIRSLRQEHDRTQPQLAEAMGVEQSYLSKLENGKSVPSSETFSLLLNVFNLSAEELLSGVSPAFVQHKLAHIPAVASVLNRSNSKTFFCAKYWLLNSAVLCILGIGLFCAGHFGWLFPETVYTYRSPGIVLEGEPGNIFDTHLRRSGTGEDLLQKRQALIERLDDATVSIYHFRGSTFTTEVKGGIRRYELEGERTVGRAANRYLRFAAVLLVASGLFGFLLQHKLSKLSRKLNIG